MGIVILIIVSIMYLYKYAQAEELKEKVDILTSENISLKRVMAAEGLIPKEYVK